MQSTLSFLSIGSILSTLVGTTPLGVLQLGDSILAGHDYVGCYTEATGMRALTGKVMYNDAMTIEICAASCAGFTWFGVEYGRECYCGNTLNTGSKKVPPAACSFTCPGNSVESCGAGDHLTMYAKIGTVEPALITPSKYGSLGCYTEATTGRALGDANFNSDSMTVEQCASKCTGFSMFGVEYGRECYCGNALRAGSIKAIETQCPYTCAGNSQESCGGDLHLRLYKFGADNVLSSEPEKTFGRQGCYTEISNGRALSAKSYFDDSMTVEKCATTCAGYTLFGVEYGRECYCGYTLDTRSKTADDSDCSFSCPGDKTETCGAGDRINLFKFGARTPTSSSASSSLTSSITSSSKISSSTTNAQQSSTHQSSTTTTSASPTPTGPTCSLPANNLAGNPTFESTPGGSISPWQATVFSPVQFFLTGASNSAICGSQVGIFRFTGVVPGEARIRQDWAGLTPGRPYNYSAYFRRDTTSVALCSVTVYVSTTTYQSLSRQSISTFETAQGGSWVKLAGVYTPPADNGAMQLIVSCTGATDVYVDNVTFAPA